MCYICAVKYSVYDTLFFFMKTSMFFHGLNAAENIHTNYLTLSVICNQSSVFGDKTGSNIFEDWLVIKQEIIHHSAAKLWCIITDYVDIDLWIHRGELSPTFTTWKIKAMWSLLLLSLLLSNNPSIILPALYPMFSWEPLLEPILCKKGCEYTLDKSQVHSAVHLNLEVSGLWEYLDKMYADTRRTKGSGQKCKAPLCYLILLLIIVILYSWLRNKICIVLKYSILSKYLL